MHGGARGWSWAALFRCPNSAPLFSLRGKQRQCVAHKCRFLDISAVSCAYGDRVSLSSCRKWNGRGCGACSLPRSAGGVEEAPAGRWCTCVRPPPQQRRRGGTRWHDRCCCVGLRGCAGRQQRPREQRGGRCRREQRRPEAGALRRAQQGGGGGQEGGLPAQAARAARA
eukprot:jgi/Mesen1/417/ME000100S10651